MSRGGQGKHKRQLAQQQHSTDAPAGSMQASLLLIACAKTGILVHSVQHDARTKGPERSHHFAVPSSCSCRTAATARMGAWQASARKTPRQNPHAVRSVWAVSWSAGLQDNAVSSRVACGVSLTRRQTWSCSCSPSLRTRCLAVQCRVDSQWR